MEQEGGDAEVEIESEVEKTDEAQLFRVKARLYDGVWPKAKWFSPDMRMSSPVCAVIVMILD